MDVKGEVLLQLFNKSKLRNGTKMFLELKFFSIYSQIKKLGFSAPLSYVYRSAKFDAKFFNFFARLFILFYFWSKKFRTSTNGKRSKQASEKVEKFRIEFRRSVNVAIIRKGSWKRGICHLPRFHVSFLS